MLSCIENDIENKDLLYYIPLFASFDILVPKELGIWHADINIYDSVEAQAHRTGAKPKQTETGVSKVITFSEASLPSQFEYIDEFKSFEYVKAKIETSAWEAVKKKDDGTLIFDIRLNQPKEDIETVELETKEILLVKAAEVIIHFFKKYNIGLFNLAYFFTATPLASFSYIAKIAREVIKNQLGDASNIYENKRVCFNVKAENKESCERYLPFDYVLAMYGFAQIHKKRKFSLPDNNACIIFNNQNLFNIQEKDLEIMFFDYGMPLEDKKVFLTEHPEYSKKIKDDILLLKRRNVELQRKHQTLKQAQVHPKKGFRTPPENERALIVQKFVKQSVDNLPQEIKVLVEDIQKLYIQLVKIATENKEQVLALINEKNKRDIQVNEFYKQAPHLRENFITLPGNTEGLWPNFAALPTGYCRDLDLIEDEKFGEHIRITTGILEHKKVFIGEQHAPLIIPLEKVTVEDISKAQKLECINLLLDKGQCPGYIIQGIIVLSKLLRGLGGLEHAGKVVRIYYEQFIDTLRTNREKRSRALGTNKDEKTFFKAIIELLNMFYYKRYYKTKVESKSGKTKEFNNWEEIRGLFHIQKRGDHEKELYYDITFNQNLFKLIDPKADSPMFLQSNAKSLLSLPEQSLDYAPAAQLSLETLARVNLYGKNRNTILFGKKGYESGISRGALIHRFGLLKGKGDNISHILRRLDRILNNLKETGVIKNIKINGREAADKMDTQLLIDMHDDYKTLYNINRWENEAKRLQKQLEAPLNLKHLPQKYKNPNRPINKQ